ADRPSEQAATTQPSTKQASTKQPVMKQSSTKQASTTQPVTKQAAAKQAAARHAGTEPVSAKPVSAKQPATKQESDAESGALPSVATAPATPPVPVRATRPWVPRAAGWLCYLLGMFDILSALFPRVRHLESVNKYGHLVPGLQVNLYAIAASLIVG